MRIEPESDETKKERREKSIQLSIKMQRAAFSRLARDLARIGRSVPLPVREKIEKMIAETPAHLEELFREFDRVEREHAN